jgi:hypothetical protein
MKVATNCSFWHLEEIWTTISPLERNSSKLGNLKNFTLTNTSRANSCSNLCCTYKHEFALQGYTLPSTQIEFIRNLKLIVLLVVFNLLDGEFIEWNSSANLTNFSVVGIWNQICCWLSATCKWKVHWTK